MRFFLCSTVLLSGLAAHVPEANARYCNAGHGCAINCEGTCGCIYRRDEKTCECWCESAAGNVGKDYGVDFNGASLDRIRNMSTPADFLKKTLSEDAIKCLEKKGPNLKLSAKAATSKQLSEQIRRACR